MKRKKLISFVVTDKEAKEIESLAKKYYLSEAHMARGAYRIGIKKGKLEIISKGILEEKGKE